jgi:hypothetical protein
MSASTYLRQKLVDLVTSVASYTPPPLYLSLHTADPTAAGSHAAEVSGGGYARQSLAGKMGAANSSGISVNTVVINFGPASADWGTITHIGIEGSLSGGNMLASGAPAKPRTVTSGQPFQIPPGKLQIRLT